MGITAYKRTISDTEAPRQIERRVLIQVTAELESHLAFDDLDKRIDKLTMLADGLRNALWKNQNVWMTFKHDLAEKNNALPAELRASLISLAIWVESHSQAVMSGERKIAPLINVNRSIIRGLSGNALHETE